MKTVLRIFLVAAFPLLILLAWVRIMLLPAFVELEYQRPGFPPDPFGFTTAERIHWANISREYLLTGAGPDFFAQYHLADGAPLYNEREADHMADVQVLVQKAMQLFLALGVLYLAAGILLFIKDRAVLRRTLAIAGLGTAGFLIVVVAAVAVGWDWFFVTFHEVFFTGETWLFPYSDTLIRLFPVQFWQDGSAAAVIGMLLTSLLVWFAAAILPRWIGKRTAQ
jgi:integral membrane protein (TIGR01906 family)